MPTPKKPAARKKAPAKRAAVKKPVKPRVKAGTNKEAAGARKRLFAQAVIANGGNKTEAAIAAGFSPHTAAQQGSRLFKDVEVQRIVAAASEKLAAKFELTTEAVLRNLSQAIFFDPRKLYREDGTLKAVHELDDDTAQALAGFEVTEEFGPAPATEGLELQAHGGGLKRQQARTVLTGYTAKVKWLDKNTAREQAMKHLGQYREDNKQRSPLDGIPREMLKELAERLRG